MCVEMARGNADANTVKFTVKQLDQCAGFISERNLDPFLRRCDRCTATPDRRDWSTQAQTLLEHLAEKDGTDLRRLGERLALVEPGRNERWTWLARRLVQEELIRESDDGVQRLYLRDSGRRFLDDPWPLDYAA